jgi:hypothetical protein
VTDERPTPAETEPTPAEVEIPADADAAQPVVEETVARERLEVRRAPKYFNFMLVFAVLAGIAVTIITFSMPYDPETANYDRNTVFGFALLISVAFGFALGAVVALIAERVTRRSARVVEVAHVTGTVKHPGE